MTKPPTGSPFYFCSRAQWGWARCVAGALVLLASASLGLRAGVANAHLHEAGRAEAPRTVVAPVRSTASLRPGALAAGELQLVGLRLRLPSGRIDIPQGSPFVVRVNVLVGDHEATAEEAARLAPASTPLEGTLSGPGMPAQTVVGTLGTGLSLPPLPEEGDYTLSGVRATFAGRGPVDAEPSAITIHGLGQVLISQVTSTPMTLEEIRNAGISLGPGSYEGRRFTLALTIGSRAINLSVPVAIPVYNGLEDPRGGEGIFGRLEIGNFGSEQGGLPDLTVVGANIVPEKDPFSLSRPAVSHMLRNSFKALLVIPGSIGYLHQFYKADVVVFNTLKPESPYVVSHMTATYTPPPAADGVGPLRLVSRYEPGVGSIDTNPRKAVRVVDGTGQGPDQLKGGDSGMATFYFEGLKEGSHPLNFVIQGQFEGGDLQTPVPLQGVAQGKVLIRNPTFNLVLVHPDIVRKGEEYTLEARLTNTSGAIANAVSLSIDRARLGGVRLISEPVQSVDTLVPGETASFKFRMRALATGEVQSSYLYIEEGTIGFQLSTGIGERSIRLNPDTLVLPQSLQALPEDLRESMLRLLGQAYSIATTKGALPSGVLPIARGVITDRIANALSEQGLALRMGVDPARVWWELWGAFNRNADPGFDQLIRTTEAGDQLRRSFLKAWPWADALQGLAARLRDMARFGAGSGGQILVGIQGAEPGLSLSVVDPSGQVIGSADPLPSLPLSGSALAQADGLRLFQVPAVAAGTYRLVLVNGGSGPQNLKVVTIAPAANAADPVASTYDFTLGWTVTGQVDLGVDRGAPIKLIAASGEALTQIAPQSVEDAGAEPFQALAVHRYDPEISPDAAPYGTQVLVLFNRTVMPLDIPNGEAGFQAAQALIQVEANQPWRKVLGFQFDENGAPVLDDQGRPVRPDSPPALMKAFPKVVSLYLEKPVGPYIPRTLTLSDAWKDDSGHPIQGERTWLIRSGYFPGGAVVKGHIRKLDGTGVPGRLTYWYWQKVNNAQVDLATGQLFAAEFIDYYYALATNNVATEPDGSFQLDFVPEAWSDWQGPFVLQGDTEGGKAFAQASVLGNGQLIQVDLVLEGKGVIEGYVVDAQGYGVPGAQVQATQEQQTIDLNRGTGGGAVQLSAVTDSEGRYRIEGLKTGVFSLRVLKDLFGAAVSGEIQHDGEVVRRDVVLKGRVGSIRVQLLGLDGQPVRDQFIRLGFPSGLIRNGSGPQTYIYPEQAKADGDGWVRFHDVPAGDFHVFVPHIRRTEVTDFRGYLDPGTEAVVTLRIVPAAELARVRVYVVDSLGRPVPNALAKYTDSIYNAGQGYDGQTDLDGFTPWIAQPSGAPFGRRITAFATHPGWVGVTTGEAAVLQPGGEYTLLVRMPARSGLAGTVRRTDGTPVKGAYVAIPPVYDDNRRNRLSITDDQGRYTIPSVPADQAFRLAVVGPDLKTYANLQVQVRPETTQTVDLTLPLVGNFTIDGTVYQPLEGSQKIPTIAQTWVESLLPSVSPTQEGNEEWGLPFYEEVANARSLPEGTFSLRGLPLGPYVLHASNDFFPVTANLPGSFDNFAEPVQRREIFLISSFAGELKGRVYARDGQTPAPQGVRVTLKGLTTGEYTVMSQADGTYKFAKVLPAGWYRLRAEDPTSGDIFSTAIELKQEESQVRNIRLWGRGALKIRVLDSLGQTLPEGVVELTHSKMQGNPYVGLLLEPGDLPDLFQRLLPEHQGLLVFEDLLEGPISLRLRNPNGLQGSASAEIPAGGGDVEVSIQLQPIGNVRGLLKRPDGSLVSAGRVDAYIGFRWLGVSPTSIGGEAGRFVFEGLPAGTVQLEAFDPDTRQVGRASVTVNENQTTTFELITQDLGPVNIQVLKEGIPVSRAGLQIRYAGGPALSFTAEATTDQDGNAAFTLPPGEYAVEATDPVTLSTGNLRFSRAANQGAIAKTLTLRAVRSVYATVLPPPGAPGLSLEGWRLQVAYLNRTIQLDAQGQGVLRDLPVGSYQLDLTDLGGNARGRFPLTVLEDGGAVQPFEIQALAYGAVSVQLLDQRGQAVPLVQLYLEGGIWQGIAPTTDINGHATFYRVRQGSGHISGANAAPQAITLSTEGEVVEVTIHTTPTARVHGRVTDPSGNPAAYISVQLRGQGVSREAATDADGRYEMVDLPIGVPVSLTAITGTGRQGFAGPLTLSIPDQDLQVDVPLQPQGRLAGTFTDALRPQLPSLNLEVLSSGLVSMARGSTGENGAFEFAALPASIPLILRATWDDGRTVAFQESFTIPGEGELVRMDRALPPFVHLRGWTLDRQGNKIPMTVALIDDTGHEVGRAVTTGDIFDPDHPTFFFRYLRAGRAYRLFGTREGLAAPTAFLAVTPSGQIALEQVEIIEAAPRSLRLQLRYPDGSAASIAGAHALITGRSPLGGSWTLPFANDGSIAIEGIFPGPADIRVSGLSWQQDVVQSIQVADQDGLQNVDLPVRGLGTLALRFQTPSGEVATEGQVSLSVFGRTLAGRLDPDGAFVWDELPIGLDLAVHALAFSLRSSQVWSLAPLTTHGERRQEVLAVPGWGAIAGRLLDAGGQPLPGGRVSLFVGYEPVPAQETFADANGAYQFARLPLHQAFKVQHLDGLGDFAANRLELSSDQETAVADLRLHGLGAARIRLRKSNGAPLTGVTVRLTAPDAAGLQGTTNGDGDLLLGQVPAGVDWTAAFPLPVLGSQIRTLRVAPGQTQDFTWTDQAGTRIVGPLRRPLGQGFPPGTRLWAGGRAVDVAENGQFDAVSIPLTVGVQALDLSLSIQGQMVGSWSQAFVLDGDTQLDLAPAFGTVRGRVTAEGQPVAGAYLVFGNQAASTDGNGMGPIWYAPVGARFQIQASKDGDVASMEGRLDQDGQALILDLDLASGQVRLPVDLTLSRLGYAYSTSRFLGGLAPIFWSVDGSEQAWQMPAFGRWMTPGRSLSLDETRGDITLTQILTDAGYGLRQEFIATNTGTVARRVSFRIQTGALKPGQDLQLGTPGQVGGGRFDHATLSWGKGSYVPAALAGNGNDLSAVWPELVLQPGETKGFWVGQTPYGTVADYRVQGIPGYFTFQDAAAPLALTRMIGGAPEWTSGLDARTTLGTPSSVTSELPAWNDTRTLVLTDPTGQPVERLGGTLFSRLTPVDPLGPVANWTWGGESVASGPQVAPRTFTQLPPGGGAYLVGTVSGTLDQTTTAVRLAGWTVATFRVQNGDVDGQPGAHTLRVNANFGEVLTSASSSRYTLREGQITARLEHAQNDGLVLNATVQGNADQEQIVDLAFPALSSLDLACVANLGVVELVNGTQTARASWSNGHYLFPAVAAGAQQVRAIQAGSVTGWDLGTLNLAAGPNQQTLGLGSAEIRVLDGFGQLRAISPDIYVTQGNRTDYATYPNPAGLLLPAGAFRITVRDRVSGWIAGRDVTITAGQSQVLAFTWGTTGSVRAAVSYAAGGTPPAGTLVTLRDVTGTERQAATDAAGSATYLGLPSGPAVLRATHPVSGLTATAAVVIPEGGTAEAALSLSAGGTLQFQIRGADGRPVPGRPVQVYQGASYAHSAITDANGIATVPNLALRTSYTVRDSYGDGSVWNPKFPDQTFTLVNEAEVAARAATLPLGSLAVAVTDARANQPLAGVYLSADSRVGASTGADGRALLTGLPLDTPFTLTAGAPGYASRSQTVTLASASPAGSLALSLASSANLYVQAYRANGLLAPNSRYWWEQSWTFTLTPEGGSPQTVPSSGAGTNWYDLPLGTYTISAARHVGTHQSGDLNDVRVYGNDRWPWQAQSSVTLDGSQSNVALRLTMPALAALTLQFQDGQGHALTHSRELTLRMAASSTPAFAIPDQVFYPSSTPSLAFGEHFPEGAHQFVVMDRWLGPVAQFQVSVDASKDGTRILQTVPVLLPLTASLHLDLTDSQGRALAQYHTLFLRLLSTTAAGYAPPPVPYYGGNLPQIFPVGTHRFQVADDAFGEVGQFTLEVTSTDANTVLSRTVALNYIRARWAATVVAGDHETPVPTAYANVAGVDNAYSAYLPLTGNPVELEVVPGKTFRAETFWDPQDGGPRVSAVGESQPLSEGKQVSEVLELPLTVVRAWLKDQDGVSSIPKAFVQPESIIQVQNGPLFPDASVIENPDQWVDPQGRIWALYFGAPGGSTQGFRIWDGESGLGEIQSATVAGLGFRTELTAQMPPYSTLTVNVQSADGQPLQNLHGGVPQDTPGLVAPWHGAGFDQWNEASGRFVLGPRRVPLQAQILWFHSYFLDEAGPHFTPPTPVALPPLAAGQTLEIQATEAPLQSASVEVHATRQDGTPFDDAVDYVEGQFTTSMPNLPYGFEGEDNRFFNNGSVFLTYYPSLPFSIRATATLQDRLLSGSITPEVPPGGFTTPLSVPLSDAGPVPPSIQAGPARTTPRR